MRVFNLDLVDDIDTKIHVHGFIAQDVLELFCDTGHFIAATHGQDLGETDIKEDAFKDDVECNQFA